jgi:putative transposase
MQLIAARTAQEFNSRKNRKGAFWEDRYHATAVQTDSHLTRCIAYIDLNMVRANAVGHPGDWEVCGYNEIQSPCARKGVIDFELLMNFLNVKSQAKLADLQNQLLSTEIANTQRDLIWTEPVAVGDEQYLQEVRLGLGARGVHRKISYEHDAWTLREHRSHYLAFLDTKWGN